MRTKSWILLAVALGCGLVASVAISQVVLDQKKQTVESPMVEILIAAKDIDAANKLTKENIRLEKWPKDRVPSGAVVDPKDVDGKFANQSIYQGEPIVKKKLINSTDGLSNIPRGHKLFDLEVNDKNGGKFVKPGDHVDIFGFFEKIGKIGENKSMIIVENVTVKAVDGNAVRDNGEQASKTSKTIQLLIRDSQYEAVNTASNVGKLRVAIRPLSDDDNEGSQVDNGEAFLAWIKSVDAPSDPREGSSPIAVPAPTPAQPVAKNEPIEMLVISPSGHTKYRWKNKDDRGLPELVGQVEGKSRSAMPERQQLVSGVNAVNPGTAGNMVWNAEAGKWTTSGFSPAYPGGTSSDDDGGGSVDASDSGSESE